MRTARFRDRSGSVRTGEWTDDGIVAAGRVHDPEDVTLLAPVEPTKVLGCGRNYWSRFEDSGDEPPAEPHIWFKGGPNVVAAHGDTVVIPGDEVVFEGEVGVVIGKQCRNVAETDVPDAIAGYTVVNDLSDRSVGDDPIMFRKKSFDNSAPLGPVLASPDRVAENPRIRLWVNGEQRQDTAGDAFVFSIPEVVVAFAKVLTLEPGDVIMMGNPGGFAPLEDGDHIAIDIEGVGRLEHMVTIAEDA